MKKRLTINKVIIVVIFAVFIFSLVRQGIALKRIKESLSGNRPCYDPGRESGRYGTCQQLYFRFKCMGRTLP